MEYNTPKFRNAEINARVLNLMHIYMMIYSPVKQLYTLFFFLPDPASSRRDRAHLMSWLWLFCLLLIFQVLDSGTTRKTNSSED